MDHSGDFNGRPNVLKDSLLHYHFWKRMRTPTAKFKLECKHDKAELVVVVVAQPRILSHIARSDGGKRCRRSYTAHRVID